MRSLLKLLLLAVALATPAFAHAESFVFTTTIGSVSFSIPGSPVTFPDGSGTYFGVPGISYTGTGSFASGGSAIFYFNNTGDFAFNNGSTFPYGIHVPVPGFSGVMYTGTATSPTFVDGTYKLTYENPLFGGPDTPASLVITSDVAATPEPSSFILLGTGVMGVVGAARRRFIK